MDIKVGNKKVLFGGRRSISKGSGKHKLLKNLNKKNDWFLKPHVYSTTYNQAYVKACKELDLIQERKFPEDKRKYQIKITTKGKKVLHMLNRIK
jgi:ribosomal protein L28